MAELHVSKKNIRNFLGGMQGRKFIIPDYQRPYKWDVEKCGILWDDIQNFIDSDPDDEADYFLGTIVSFMNENRSQEIIDGQQRITSFFLLLRSFYKKLEGMDEDEDVRGLKNQLAPCIWDINPISQQVSDNTKIHIESLVATEEDNAIFHNILAIGETDIHAKDNYSLNYRFFMNQCNEYAQNHPMRWKQLCITILQKCIILPIECDDQETALTIFSTLNDRGLPLADSDIFKAQIYKYITDPEDRRVFTDTWKELTRICNLGRVSIDDIFRYYSHVLRARKSDKSKEVGLRKFYSEDNYERLHQENLMNEIMILANFWLYINTNKDPDEDAGYHFSVESRKYLHCLSCYPNEFWKYPTNVFLLKNMANPNFDTAFLSFLKKLVAFLFTKFIETPTVNAIKDDIYSACIAVQDQKEQLFRIELNRTIVLDKMDNHISSKMARGLLLLDAYLHTGQVDLIPSTFDIEHIFPKKWQDANYFGWTVEDAKLYLDKFGNKIVFEKKLNIQAGNGYFGSKKKKYNTSAIACVKDLANYPDQDWLQKDILQRDNTFKSNLVNFFEAQLN